MGLAASQGRYLALTARNSDLVYEAQQISQQRLALATQTQSVADEYNEAMSNTVLLANLVDGSQRLTYDIITSKDAFSGLNMRIVDTNGNVVVPPNPSSISVTYTDENGEEVTETITSASFFANKYMSEDIQLSQMGTWSLEELVDYYNEKGQAMKKFLHKKPMAYQQARISSPFGKRRHPIYKDVRIHWGVDYAAPKGSAVYAGGDGVIVAAKYNGGYGKYIKIRHNSEFSTAYGHLNGYAKGIRPGVRVKQGQLIAYVGSTGRSTGPHLHYEVIKNGKRVNPLTIKAATGNNLGGQNLKKFKTMVADLKKSYSTMFAESETKKLAKK